MWTDRYSAHPDYDSPESRRFIRLFRNADFDPVVTPTLMMTMAMAGGAMTAAGTIAAGNAAATTGRMQQQAAEFQATQDTMNSAADIASAQRQSLDIATKARLAESTAMAAAAAGGVTTTTGSPLTNEAQIAARGHYAAALELWNGQNAASGDLNKAAAAHYSGIVDRIGGEMQQKASYFSAAGTLASSGASAYKMYGMGGGYGGPYGNIGYGTGVGQTGPIPRYG